jgi:hypothetical protein
MIHELPKRGPELEAMFRELCRDDQHAVNACWAAWRFLHVIDDLADRDHPVPVADVGIALLDFTETAALNPFWQSHARELAAVLRVGVMEWVDSEKWRQREDVREKLAAEVIKSGYQNLFYLIAGLVGGTSHMQAMTEKWRQFQWD